ncbi:MAG: hypothetical protein IJS09_06965 [Treponema sp.]|nr:hypothetical protein [Treponema sp.]
MDLFVNGNNIDITIENEKTVGDVLKGLEEEFARNDATTISIVLNGKKIEADEFEEASQTPLADDTKLVLTVISVAELRESFAYEGKIAREIAGNMEQIPVQLQSGKDKEASTIIARLADLVDSFCKTSSLASLFPDLYNSIKIDGKDLNEFFSDFSAILTDFKQALEDKDTVLIGDLAEYEISPRLNAIADATQGDA